MFNLFSNIKTIGIGILGIVTLWFWGRNSKLSKENKNLSDSNEHLHKKAEISKKVTHAIKNNKPTTLSANVERMRKDKL